MTTIVCEIRDRVATLTLDRPDQRNALNSAMCTDLVEGVRTITRDLAVRVMLVRANGPVFCAGADLKERRGMTAAQVRARRLAAFDAYAALESLTIPTVAVVEGPAIGSGCEIASACDFIVATPQASFRTPEALLGTVGASQRLPRILGTRLAKDLMFTGRSLTAAEALVAGLVSRLVETDELETVIAAIVETIVPAPAITLALAKRCIDRGVEQDPRGALDIELEAIDELQSARTHDPGHGTTGDTE